MEMIGKISVNNFFQKKKRSQSYFRLLIDDEDVSHVNPTVTNERTEIDTSRKIDEEERNIYLVSGDSWEREFDENITSKTTIISSDQLQQTIPMNNSVLPVTVTKNTENEFDDEWESWS
jgi:hypothetical protein